MDAPFFFRCLRRCLRCRAAIAVWRAALVLSLVALADPSARGATIRVPADQPTIQAGIDATVDGDTVLVDTGTYRENIDFLAKNVTVASHYLVTGDSAYIDNTVIQAGLRTSPAVTIAGGQPRDTRLCGFTITGGAPPHGRGVHCRDSSPTIDHNRIWQNRTAQEGGGVRIERGAPAVRYNRIEGNVTENYSFYYGGAGIHVVGSTAEIEHNRIIGNTAGGFGWGGGICVSVGSPIIRANVIGFNEAGERGGGIACENSEPVIVDNEICSNTALSYNGGGIANRNGAPVIERNLIHDNDGGQYGGGLFY